jgi:hypothetical protein
MKKYRVFMEGRNIALNLDGETKCHGFFTARFLEAGSNEEAEAYALQMVNKELEGFMLNRKEDPPVIIVEEVSQLESFDDHLVPGKGFTWYEETIN